MFPTQVDTLERIRDLRSLDIQVGTQPIFAPTIWSGTDRFAALRMAGFSQLTGHQQVSENSTALNEWAGFDILSHLSALEYDWAKAFQTGFPFEQVPFEYVDTFAHSAILRGLNRSRITVDPTLLIEQIGVSASSDSLIRDMLARLLRGRTPASFGSDLRSQIRLKQNNPKALAVLLDIASKYDVAVSKDQQPVESDDILIPATGKSYAMKADGIVIAQFMFLGEIGQAGKGDSGGLGVFLSSLGDAMARTPGVAHVYTLVLVAGQVDQLQQHTGVNHTIIQVPVNARAGMDQREMMVNEMLLENAIERTLYSNNIQPDIFHLRYADHGSLAAYRVAKRMGKKVVYTLTADPHRTLANQFTQFALDDAEMQNLDFALQRVYAADQLLEGADGLVAMPTSTGLDPLKMYFPQFQFDPDVQEKPLKILSEGIELLQPDNGDFNPVEHVQSLLAPDFLRKPIMLNVGRLHPVKQQHLLVEAWASSGLWNTYNLVLIGGNLEDPSPVEAEMLGVIQGVFDRYPQAQDHFRLLPAMDNQKIRKLESALVQHLPHSLPHIYACSSLKEEFGIAVLEAMDAGLLVIGPERGGLSSYIDNGYNGFLMDTGSAVSIIDAFDWILKRDEFSVSDLHAAAAAGQTTVQASFDIEVTAQAFTNFYQQVLDL
jgi:glycosyltransferase involved in cell wall biosynthesis